MINETPDDRSAINTRYPNLAGYLDEAELDALIAQHTENELLQIELAFDTIEAAMIRIHRHLEASSHKAITDAISTIWDNARDLLDDED